VKSKWWNGKYLEGSGRSLILKCYPVIRLEGLRKTTKNLSQDSLSSGRHSSPGSPEYEAGVLTSLSAVGTVIRKSIPLNPPQGVAWHGSRLVRGMITQCTVTTDVTRTWPSSLVIAVGHSLVSVSVIAPSHVHNHAAMSCKNSFTVANYMRQIFLNSNITLIWSMIPRVTLVGRSTALVPSNRTFRTIHPWFIYRHYHLIVVLGSVISSALTIGLKVQGFNLG
jgi:hypothetical protein